MTLSPKKWSCTPKIFSPFFSKNFSFFKKIIRRKNILNLPLHKKDYIDFRRQTPPFLQKRLGPQKQFFAIFSENKAFFEKPIK